MNFHAGFVVATIAFAAMGVFARCEAGWPLEHPTLAEIAWGLFTAAAVAAIAGGLTSNG